MQIIRISSAKLRKAGGEIHETETGYQLSFPANEVDMSEHSRLLRESGLDAGDAEYAITRLYDAVRLVSTVRFIDEISD